MSENALNVLERIKHNRQEQDQCYHALELWAAVKAQGIEIDHVESFGYDPKLSPKDVKIRMHTIQSLNNGNDPFIKKLPNGGYQLLAYNFVRLKDGTTKVLTPMLKAIP